MQAWEYASIVVTSTATLIRTLNNAGAKGWEVVTVTSNEQSMAANSLVAIVKRGIVAFDPPEDDTADWKIDPSDRHQMRYWDGECWTFLVSNDGDESRDPPTKLEPAQRIQ